MSSTVRIFVALTVSGADDDVVVQSSPANPDVQFPLTAQMAELAALGPDNTVTADSTSPADLHAAAVEFVLDNLTGHWTVDALANTVTLHSLYNPLEDNWIEIGTGNVVVGWRLLHRGAAILGASEDLSTGGGPAGAQIVAVLGVQHPA